jgi:hypothetical protein
MKCLSMSLTKTEPSVNKRKTAMVLFSVLRRMTDLNSACEAYRLIYIVLCNRQESEVVVQARQQLLAYAAEEPCVVLENDENERFNDNDDNENDNRNTVHATREGSPFTKIFNDIVSNVDSDTKVDDSTCSITNLSFSPGSFSSIRSQMFLFPVWSAVLQSKVDRFANDLPHGEMPRYLKPICRSNAAIESHFRSAKKDRRNAGQSVRPKQFIDAELAFVLGKVNERKLPKRRVQRANKRLCISDMSEKWNKRRRPKQYATPSKAVKVLANFSRPQADESPVRIGRLLSYSELDDNDVDTALEILRRTSTDIDGLEHPGLGQYCKGLSSPRFVGAVGRFVQVFHLPQHWVCATNAFSEAANEVYWYDSIAKDFVVEEAIVQLTSMLRHIIGNSSLVIRLRHCPQQPNKTKICGHFAVLAAFAVCSGHDPTLLTYDPSRAVEFVRNGIQTGNFCTLQLTANPNPVTDIKVLREAQRLCICQRPMDDQTVRCATCNNWFHAECVDLTCDINGVWNGPCHKAVENPTVIEINERFAK